MTRIFRAGTAFLVSGWLLSVPARAEPSAQQKAAAEALFQSAANLIEQARYAEACEKFEASHSLDPGLGTRLRMADCYDRMGRSASAWAVFVEVAAISRALGQSAREQIAEVRVRDLESRLSKLTIETDAARSLSSFQVRLNGTRIPKASWGVPIPVDPGSQLVEVSAPGFKPWSARIEVPRGPAERSLIVPPLEPLASGTAATFGRPVPQPAPPVNRDASQGRPLVWAGVVSSAAGLVGLGIGAVFGYRAWDLNQESLESCRSVDANACTPLGKERRDDAQGAANVATAATIAGGAVLAIGVTLLVISPESPTESAAAIRLLGSTQRGFSQLKLEGGF